MAFYKCARIYVTENSNTEINTASGPIANFNTLLATPLLSLKANFKATQDLHGQSGPYPAGGSAQIWDEQWEIGSFDNSGNPTASNDKIRTVNFIPCQPNVSYYAKGSGMVLFFYDENHDFISSTTKTNGSFTTPLGAYFIKFRMATTYGIVYNNDLGINYPSTDTAYHPYSNICPISGITGINLYHSKKNVFNPELCVLENYYEVNSDGTIKVLASNAKTWDTLPEIPIKAGTYTVSKTVAGGRLTIRTALSNYESNAVALLDGQTSASFTIAEDTKFRIKIMTSYSSYPVDVGIMIEFGSTATNYEPFNGTTALINLGGTYYGGYVEQDKDGKRELVVTHEITDLGEQTWNYSVWGAGYVFSTNLPAAKDQAASGVKGDIICSIYNNISASEMYNSNPNYSVCLNRTNVRITNSDYSNRDTFKVAMNGIMLVYELAEPFTIALPDGERIKSFAGINNIYADTGDTTIEYRNIVQGG